MKIIHIADCHLGFSTYTKIDPVTGLNTRELDFYKVFLWTIDFAKSESPDLVIISGDLFHVRKPPASAIVYAQSALGSLNCPVLIIAGNHDNAAYGVPSPLLVFRPLPNVITVEEPSVVKLERNSFYCLPYTTDPVFEDADFLIAHIRDSRVPRFKSSGIIIPTERYKFCFLGDYHVPTSISDNAYYSGSLERITFNQLGSPCGFGYFKDDNYELVETPTRKFVEISVPPKDLEVLKGAIVRCKVKSLVGQDWISDVRSVALYVTVKTEEESQISFSTYKAPSSIMEAFKEFCAANLGKYSQAAVQTATFVLEKSLTEG